jgi:hypothetical protein
MDRTPRDERRGRGGAQLGSDSSTFKQCAPAPKSFARSSPPGRKITLPALQARSARP